MMLICVGLSHRQAPIAVRERVAVAEEQIESRLRELKALPGVREAMLLSTCNRVEIFAVAESRGAGDDLLQGLGPVAAPHAARRFEEDRNAGRRCGEPGLQEIHLRERLAAGDGHGMERRRALGQAADLAGQRLDVERVREAMLAVGPEHATRLDRHQALGRVAVAAAERTAAEAHEQMPAAGVQPFALEGHEELGHVPVATPHPGSCTTHVDAELPRGRRRSCPSAP